VLKKHQIPVVQTLHDFQLLAPNYLLYDKGKVCPVPKKFHWYNIFFNTCQLEYYPKTVLAGFCFYIYRLFNLYPKPVDYFLTPSKFLKQKIDLAGFKQPVEVMPNFLTLSSFEPNYEPGDYLLCPSRITKGKGIFTLIKAVRKLPEIKLKIVGDGPLLPAVKKYIKTKQIKNIEILGYVEQEKVFELIKGSRMVVIASQMYENYPMAVIEAMALGKPVIGSSIGGIPELVIPNKTGTLFKPGSIKDLRQEIKQLWPDTDLISKLGQQARKHIEQNNSSEQALQNLKLVYNRLLDHDAHLG
jgi:glycosyltransferase involved in cell wall biosynthesis